MAGGKNEAKGNFVFSNLAVSVDGKISTAGREAFLLGSAADRKGMLALRKRADVLLMGAETLRTHRRACTPRGSKGPYANAIVSHRLEGIDPEWPFFQDPSVRRLLFVSADAREETLARFRDRSEIVLLNPAQEPTGSQLIRELVARGMPRILVEGGGGLMWDFARENLIDEYHVTLTPWVIGGSDAPTLVDGEGFDPAHALKLSLKRAKKVGNEVFLVYERRA